MKGRGKRLGKKILRRRCIAGSVSIIIGMGIIV